jgi:uncharacterized protein (TIGR03083 family)
VDSFAALPSPVPLDIVPMLPAERADLVALLRGLPPADWDRATECPAWTVKGIALHVLGDDLSLLSRQRDDAVPSTEVEHALPAWDGAPENVLDRFNERWVHAATFLSPQLLVAMLERTGEATHAWYASVDADAPGEVVALFGDGPAPYREIAGREFLERWVHQLQIRRALGTGPGAAGTSPIVDTAFDVVARTMTTLMEFVRPPAEASVVIEIGDARWAYALGAAKRWELRLGDVPDATVRLSSTPEGAVTLFSRGLPRARAQEALRVEGDSELGARLTAGLAAYVGR